MAPTLRAVYSGPGHESFEAAVSLDLSPSSSSSSSVSSPSSSKVAHLAALRAAITTVQANVNRELTARMVLDADRSAQDAAVAQEEANYGEEMVEEN